MAFFTDLQNVINKYLSNNSLITSEQPQLVLPFVQDSATGLPVPMSNTFTATVDETLLAKDSSLTTISNYLSTIVAQDGYLCGVAKGTNPAAYITGQNVGPNIQSLSTWDYAPTLAVYNYSVARGDGYAIRASDTTITFTGPTLTSAQLRRIRIFTDANTRPLVWEQGRNAVLSISSTTITVTALDGTTAPVPSTTTLVDVAWAAQDKGYDPSTQAQRIVPMTSDALRNYPMDCSQTVAVAGSVTTSYYIPMDSCTQFSIQWYSSAGSNTKTLKVYVSNQDDSSVALGSLCFNDVTTDWFGASIINVAAGTLTSVWWGAKNSPTCCKWVRLDISTSSNGATDNTWSIYTHRSY